MNILLEAELDALMLTKPDYASTALIKDEEHDGDVYQIWILEDSLVISYGLGDPLQIPKAPK